LGKHATQREVGRPVLTVSQVVLELVGAGVSGRSLRSPLPRVAKRRRGSGWERGGCARIDRGGPLERQPLLYKTVYLDVNR
jgi:hypothetical protein